MRPPFQLLCLSLLLPLLPNAAPAQEPSRLQQADTLLSERLLHQPDSRQLLSNRGDIRLFQGRFPEAIADFEKMIALDPAEDAPHWRLGIAYYFHGDFEKSSRQFQKYHSYDGRDRENGIWKCMADARSSGWTEARNRMLQYQRFDREPFPALYELYAGTLDVSQLLQKLPAADQTAHPDDSAHARQVRFFGTYYAGIFLELTEKKAEGLQLIQEAVALFDDAAADRGGPGYMWRVAALHARLLQKNASSAPANP